MEIKLRYNTQNNKENTSLNTQTKDNSQKDQKFHSFANIFKELSLSASDLQPNSTQKGIEEVQSEEEWVVPQLAKIGIKIKEKNESEIYLEDYGTQVERQSMQKSELGTFMDKHRVDVSLRARMLDWMTEVTCSYKFSDKTYFDGVNLMDSYFKAQQFPIQGSQIHTIGTVSMMLASKYNEAFPLRIGTVYQKIVHRKISINKLTAFQAKIMEVLSYRLNQWTFYDIAACSLVKVDNQFILQVLAYICRLVVIQYEFYCQFRPSFIGQVCAWVATVICEQPEPKWTNSRLQIVSYGRKVINLLYGFPSVHPTLRNSTRFTSVDTIDKITMYLRNHSHSTQ